MSRYAAEREAAVTSAGIVQSVTRSHVGRVRMINEDRVFESPELGIWAVADGMGGHAGGDLAAQAVVDRLRALTARARRLQFTDMLVALGQANGDIRHRNEQMHIDAGSTVVAAMINDGRAFIAWAGDSRAYLFRQNECELLTHDHTIVQELIDAGLVPASRAQDHPQSHVITRALGIDDNPRLQTVTKTLQTGDRLLLCSDGLSRSLRPDEIEHGEIAQLADQMLASALARDGSDNISLALIEY